MASKKRRVRKYQWAKRLNKHGFRTRLKSKGGRSMLLRRRSKGRSSLAPQRPTK